MIEIAGGTFRGRERPGTGVVQWRGDEWSLVGVVDGAGDWGHGVEAADWARERLQARWADRTSMTAAHVAGDIVSVAGELPLHWRNDDFGCSFAIAFLLLGPSSVDVIAAGSYSVVLLAGDAPPRFLFRARRWVTDAVEAGQLDPDVVATHPLRGVFIGPFITDDRAAAPEVVGPFAIPSGGRIVVGEELLLELLLAVPPAQRPVQPWAIQSLDSQASSGAVIVVSDG